MPLPLFYSASPDLSGNSLILDEDNSRHAVQVLRLKKGDQLNLTDGRGGLITAEIISAHKKQCSVRVLSTVSVPVHEKKITLAVSLLKNTGRFEWLVEKATEIGVREFVPLICARTEKQKLRYERLKQIIISAMLQSQQSWLPELQRPLTYTEYLERAGESNGGLKLIAHCGSSPEKRSIHTLEPFNEVTILIGPEGDFTEEEITQSQKQQFIPVTLGKTRLRTETAGLAAVVLLSLCTYRPYT